MKSSLIFNTSLKIFANKYSRFFAKSISLNIYVVILISNLNIVIDKSPSRSQVFSNFGSMLSKLYFPKQDKAVFKFCTKISDSFESEFNKDYNECFTS